MISHCGNVAVPGNSKIIDVLEDGKSGSIGVWWGKVEFINEAKKLEHPMDSETILPQRVANAIYNLAVMGPSAVIEKRRATLEWYRNRSAELQKEEEVLHKYMNAEVERVVHNKRVLLFREMLRDIAYDDMSVIELLIGGVKITGLLKTVGIWKPSGEKHPKCSIDDVWANAAAAQTQVLGGGRKVLAGSKDEKLDHAVWEETMNEVREGWMVGPLSEEELVKDVGHLWVAARRFGLIQGQKVRPIDNFAEHMVNDAFGAEEKVSLLGIDHVIAWAKAWAGSQRNGRCFQVSDNCGDKWSGLVHPGWEDNWSNLLGRVTDLKAAYKQVASHPSSKSVSVVAVTNPGSGKVELFRALSLMFGETAAVYAFLRLSRALAAVAARLFDLVVVEYFDDFTQIEPEMTSQSAMDTMEQMLDMLGWKVSKGDKRLPFMEEFNSLGVRVNLKNSKYGQIIVTNKPGRIESLSAFVNSVLEAKEMGFKEALSIKGKVQYAEGQLFGRVAAPICRLLSVWASSGSVRKVDSHTERKLLGVCYTLATAKPRVIDPRDRRKPLLLFSDGACEARTSIGAVLLEDGVQPEAFGAVVSSSLVKQWATKVGQEQVVGQAELYPLWVSRLTWGERMKGRKVIYFIDNDSARMALIKSYSPVKPSLDIIMGCVEWDGSNNSTAWYARVPTESNIADAPSRMDRCFCEQIGAKIVAPIFPKGEVFTDVL